MEISRATAGFAALSQGTRLSVLQRLVRAGPEGIAAGSLADATLTAPSTLTFHLKELTAAGLVVSRSAGRSIIYAADYEGLRRLVDFLMADCCQGDPRACGPYTAPITATEKETAQ